MYKYVHFKVNSDKLNYLQYVQDNDNDRSHFFRLLVNHEHTQIYKDKSLNSC